MDRGWENIRRAKGRNDFCAAWSAPHLPVRGQNTGTAHVRHHALGLRGILRRDWRAESGATTGDSARHGDREELRVGNFAATRRGMKIGRSQVLSGHGLGSDAANGAHAAVF